MWRVREDGDVFDRLLLVNAGHVKDAVVKLGAVASKTLTRSGRAMIEALIAGERHPQVLADLAKGRLRVKIPDLVRALDGRFDSHHAVHLRQLLDHIDWFETTIAALDGRIAELTAPWGDLIDRLQTIPGVGRRTAEVLVTETGGAMTPVAHRRAPRVVGRACHPATTSPAGNAARDRPPPGTCGWPTP